MGPKEPPEVPPLLVVLFGMVQTFSVVLRRCDPGGVGLRRLLLCLLWGTLLSVNLEVLFKGVGYLNIVHIFVCDDLIC